MEEIFLVGLRRREEMVEVEAVRKKGKGEEVVAVQAVENARIDITTRRNIQS